jgi:hypothetical protein
VLTQDKDQYVAELLAGLDAYPAYYSHMGPANAPGRVLPTCPRQPARTPRSWPSASPPVNGSPTCAADGSSRPGTSADR